MITTAAQHFDLCIEQGAPPHKIAEHPLARSLRLVQHLAALGARGLDHSLGLRGRGVAELLHACVRRGHDLRDALVGLLGSH